jgi:hypothetical protein
VQIELKQRMKKGMRERVSGGDVCDCCFGEQLDNKKPSCEDFYHFFFDCSHYSNIRHTLFQNLNWLPNYCALDLTLLTCGNPTLPYGLRLYLLFAVYQWCGFKSRRGKNKNVTALKSNSNTVRFIYIYIWKLNRTVIELDFRAVNFLFFPRRDRCAKIIDVVVTCF